MRRCTGRCCESFTLLGHSEELGDQYLVSVDQLAEEWRELFFLREVKDDGGGEYGLFGCKKWDCETKNCLIYADRPKLCQLFPENHACRHCGAANHEEAVAEVTHE